MKKATCIVSLLMALALVLMGMGPVLATADQPPVIAEGRCWEIDVAPGFIAEEVERGAYQKPTDNIVTVRSIVEPPTDPAPTVTLTYILPEVLEAYDAYIDLHFTPDAVAVGLAASIAITISQDLPYLPPLDEGEWYTITVKGTHGDHYFKDDLALRIKYMALPPFDFTLTVDYPPARMIEQGTSITLEDFVTVTHVTDTLGPYPVTLSYYGMPLVTAGLTITFCPPTVEPPRDGSATANVTIVATPYADVVPSPRFNRLDPHTITIIGTAAVPAGHPDHPYLVRTDYFRLHVIPPAHTIPLESGWNLISLPVMPLISTCIDHVLGDGGIPVDTSILDNVIRVWRHIADGTPPYFGEWEGHCFVVDGIRTLTEMKEGYGYWIKMAQPDILTVRGAVMPPPAKTPPTHQLHAGWNLIGVRFVPPVYPDYVTVAEYLGPVIIEYVGAMWYFCTTYGRFVSLDRDCALKLGHGYWIYIHAHEHPLRIATVPLD
ncbi:hypothetical protein M1N20_02660 [Dehalococcoidia bacterium]|nr:hypothetical protein [Dehalococcoidia bacterium]